MGYVLNNTFILFFGLFYFAVNVVKGGSIVQDEIKGTLFETGGQKCDETCDDKQLQDASTYTKLYLFLRDAEKNYSEIIYGNLTSFEVSGFDVNKKTKMLVHGWEEYAFDGFASDLKDSYFAADADVNVLSVDWSKVADLLYPLARIYVVPVAKFMAAFLDWLASEAGVSVESIHIIGLSLGAHVAGNIGHHVRAGKIGRITGLDPAGPGFYLTPKSGRLDSSDAQFVDVIHTCGGWAGYLYSCGHVDFYPNDGRYNQPGCSVDLGVCSHKRSYHLFNESISDEGFVARQCDSWSHYKEGECDDNTAAVMGEHIDQSKRKVFYLRTAGSYPFALGNITEQLYENEEL